MTLRKSARRFSRGGVRAVCLSSAAVIAISHAPVQSTCAQAGGDIRELSRLSLEELASVEVTSVSKVAQTLSSAPAAIYVITRDEILRSGVQSIPEALRLAPNLQVARLRSSGYSITARGFGDSREVQTQSNKLLILIDGRTVYSPLFSGVFYDAQDTALGDIERIEVISGPGATLWGANAMNGVINIITRSAANSQGVIVRAGAGNQESVLTGRYGGTAGDASYRVYAKATEHGSLEFADGSSRRDRGSKTQGGFRTDWQSAHQTVTLQGDAYRLNESVPDLDTIETKGANLLARWGLATARSDWSVQAYYDLHDRVSPPDGADFEIDTYDVQLQQSLKLGPHRVVWGLGKRLIDYRVTSVRPLHFSPTARELDLTNVFAQDTLSIGAFEITAGIKLEDNPFESWQALPDVRIAYTLNDDAMIWAAASRAIRAPTPFDIDVREFPSGTLFLTGDADFRSEQVDAFQLGYRQQPTAKLSFSINAFYNEYDHLRSLEITPVTLLPLRWGNEIAGNTYGVEAWANVQVTAWWRVAPSFRLLHKRLEFKPDAVGLLGMELTGNDPRTEASLKSSVDVTDHVTFDAYLRYVDELPNPYLDDYYELSARLAWNVSGSLQVSLSGFNLLDSRHLEYPAPVGGYTPRSVFAEVRWQY
jgi:iron complex outermembrane recepter protein